MQIHTVPVFLRSLNSNASLMFAKPSLNLFFNQRSMSIDCFLSTSFLLGVRLERSEKKKPKWFKLILRDKTFHLMLGWSINYYKL